MKLLLPSPLLRVSIILTLLFGCRKTDLNLPTELAWKRIPLAGEAQILLNSATDGKKLYCPGAYVTTVVDSFNRPEGYLAWWGISLDRRAVNAKYLLDFNEEKTVLFINSFQRMSGSGAQLPVKELDASLQYFNCSNKRMSDKIGLNNNGQVLVSAVDSNNLYHYYLLTFNIYDGYFAARPTTVTKITLPPIKIQPDRITCFDNFFFIVDDERRILHKIDEAGKIVSSVANCGGGEMFRDNGKLYLVTGSGILISADNGNSFTAGYQYSASLRDYYFKVLNENVFVFIPGAGIGKFEFTENGFEIKKLKNKGLENVTITSLAFFNKRIYATTLSGLYYLEWNEVEL